MRDASAESVSGLQARQAAIDLSWTVVQSGEHFTDTKKSYLYLSREQPQPLLHHPSHAWREPGIYVVTGDRRIKGQWFIHHDGTVVVAFAP